MEIVAPVVGTSDPWEILDTSSLMLAEPARAADCAPRALPITPDDPAALSAAVLGAAGHPGPATGRGDADRNSRSRRSAMSDPGLHPSGPAR